MRTGLVLDEVQPKLRDLVTRLFQKVPSGLGSEGAIEHLSKKELRRLIELGAAWAIERGLGEASDLDRIEEGGLIEGADPDRVSERAYKRGVRQVGTLGSGNHFLEIQVVDEVYEPAIADQLGFLPDGVVLSIHTGSRGFGYQVCDDSLHSMAGATVRHGIEVPDRQLRCAPLNSPQAEKYLAAMAAAANYAFVNRQTIMQKAKEAFLETLDISPSDLAMRLIYDVCHNIGKYEDHQVDGKARRLFVHRKGATRAFGPGDPRIPQEYQSIGQPVLIPGDMGRYSYVLVGTEGAMKETFGSSCHGAGRQMSRKQSKKECGNRDLFAEMEQRGVIVACRSRRTLAEEMPHAYKDVSHVVDCMHDAGLSKKVVRLRPIGCVKG